MLKNAYLYSESRINELILEGEYKYLNLSSYNYFETVELKESDWDCIQKVSVSDKGRLLGYFSANVNRSQNRIDSCCFVKFRYKYEDYICGEYSEYEIEELEKIADKDFKQFVDEIINHPIINYVTFSAVKDNPANKTYEKLMIKYNGEKYIYPKRTMLPDGKYYDIVEYVFNRRK